MFHAIPDLVKDSFHALRTCYNPNTKTNLYLSLVSLTKHHAKLVCAEMLLQPLPFDENVSEYWDSLTADNDLTGTIVDNFLETISEVAPYDQALGETEKAQKVLAHPPFALLCALKEIISRIQEKICSSLWNASDDAGDIHQKLKRLKFLHQRVRIVKELVSASSPTEKL